MMISVIGGSRSTEAHLEMAEEVGAEIARRGAILVCGGLTGVMEAACRGAKSAGGTTVGILPGSRRQDANPNVDIPILTTLGEARNVIVACTGQAVIAIGGEYGTLSEMAFALRNGVPVVGINTWSLSRGGMPEESITVAGDAREAVDLAWAAAERRGGR